MTKTIFKIHFSEGYTNYYLRTGADGTKQKFKKNYIEGYAGLR